MTWRWFVHRVTGLYAAPTRLARTWAAEHPPPPQPGQH